MMTRLVKPTKSQRSDGHFRLKYLRCERQMRHLRDIIADIRERYEKKLSPDSKAAVLVCLPVKLCQALSRIS